MRKRFIISMMIYGLSSAMSFANVENDTPTSHKETFVASTSEEDDAWIKIKDGEEEQAYRDFLAKYPNSQYAEQAASVVALYDAVRLYDQEKYDEAYEQFRKAMVYNSLSTEMTEKYENCHHAIIYKGVGNGSESSAREYLQAFPNGIYATEASNNIARKMADGFDNGNSYSKSGPLGYSYNDAMAYAKDFETYQYVKNKSNEKAKKHYLYADEKTNSSLKWAQDEATKLDVEDKYTAYLNSDFWDDFWDDRLALGPEFNFLDFASNTYGLDLGLSFRIGRYSGYSTSPFTFICGVKYRFHTEYAIGKGKEYDAAEGHHVVGSCQFRLNYKEAGDGSWYLGIGGEYSHYFSGDLNLGGAYFIGQFGYAIRNFDIGIYYKHRVYKEEKNEWIDDNFRIGIPLTFYF